MKKPLLIKTVAATALGLSVIGGLAATATANVDGPAATTATAVEASSKKPKADAVTETDVLSAETAMKAAQAALKEAEKQGQRVTIAIVDRSGATRLIVAGDEAGPQTEDSAVRKAFTAVSFGRATSGLAEGATGDAPNISDIPGTLFLAGGVPVAVDDLAIAGIGVGGAPSGDIDEAIANAGLAAIAGDLK
ncbi:heme-binding protein [Phytomonospora sp. NPDC050363]|uniref:GlcG/HbpS family heme-binding protein n=1 Tax=Phytomonospora sp. NPDC050363 TaxID=3155642 RepID=UPI00340456D0